MKRFKVLLGLALLPLMLLCVHAQNTPSGAAPAQAKNLPQQEGEAAKNFKGEHLFDAKVKIGKMIVVGESKRGQRRVIPITGGTFEGPNIKGEVLPGGEDWQLVRPDGDTELYARYLLKTHDGYTIQVINQVVLYKPGLGGKTTRSAQSVLDFEAPNNSPYAYLNHGIFLGTLGFPPNPTPGEAPSVIIGVYMVQ